MQWKAAADVPSSDEVISNQDRVVEHRQEECQGEMTCGNLFETRNDMPKTVFLQLLAQKPEGSHKYRQYNQRDNEAEIPFHGRSFLDETHN
jgi:hypothetical protein